MAVGKRQALGEIDVKKELLFQMSDQIWEHPQVAFCEDYAAGLFCEVLEQEGFQLERGLAGMPTAFSGAFGQGGPVIGFLGEFDALPNLSQEAGSTNQRPVVAGGPGHGCGHNLLGVGSMAAALAVKKYLQDNRLPGTVKFFGCPAEEGGAGKGFMARDGVFGGIDIAFCWHPGEVNSAATESTMANYQICYHFYGTSAHAAMSPEMGRSALDALELMNTGVQYLREHISTDTRIHYAITNAGGNSPGTVQAYAEGLYLLRAPQLPQVKALYERVNKIAFGAAMMTETRVEIEFIKACSNTVLNMELLHLLQRNMEQLPPLEYTDEELTLAAEIRKTLTNRYSYFDMLAADVTAPDQQERLRKNADADVHSIVMPFPEERQGFVSSDVGDASWVCPLAQINGATLPAGVPMHSWQMVAMGKSGIAKKGMLFAGKAMAGAAIDALEDPEIIRRAKEEKERRTGGLAYDPPIPPDVKPRIPDLG